MIKIKFNCYNTGEKDESKNQRKRKVLGSTADAKRMENCRGPGERGRREETGNGQISYGGVVILPSDGRGLSLQGKVSVYIV